MEDFNGYSKAKIGGEEEHRKGSGSCKTEANYCPPLQVNTNGAWQASRESCQSQPAILSCELPATRCPSFSAAGTEMPIAQDCIS